MSSWFLVLLKRSILRNQKSKYEIQNQQLLHQVEYLKDKWHRDSGEQKSSKRQNSYHKYGLKPSEKEYSSYRRIVNIVITDWNGSLKCTQLFASFQCVLTLNHGNNAPERGFSINKLMLETQIQKIYEDAIVAIRTVKGELNQIGGVLNFDTTCNLITDVKSYMKYEANRLTKKAFPDAQVLEKKQKEETTQKA